MYVEYDSTLFVRLLPPAPAAFLGTFAAFLPATDGVLAIFRLLRCGIDMCLHLPEDRSGTRLRYFVFLSRF